MSTRKASPKPTLYIRIRTSFPEAALDFFEGFFDVAFFELFFAVAFFELDFLLVFFAFLVAM
jgi:hypothetical protein